MDSKLDIVAILSAIGVAAYTAAGIVYLARYDLGFSFGEIRAAATVIAGVIATIIGIDFFNKDFGAPS